MRIRSITYFVEGTWPLNEESLEKAGDFIRRARAEFTEAGYEVQTVRLATTPFPQWCPLDKMVEAAQALEAKAVELGYEYLALGPATPERPESYAVIPEVLAATEHTFLSGVMASMEEGISLKAVRACAEVICRAAPLEEGGFANLRFAALANVPPGSPFFPAAYHGGGAPRFALATEAADLAVQAFTDAKGLNDGVTKLVKAVEGEARVLEKIGEALSAHFGVGFGGIDFSLAPYPEARRSLGAAMERMGVPQVGTHGSLAAAAVLAAAIDKAKFRRCGFSGLLLPQLEDAVLAKRAAEGALTVKDLLTYSAVCGTGLDTIPLSGDTQPEALAALLLDLAALALRLDKPLTARLMPIPGKQAGEKTDFDFPYFANSRVMELMAEPLRGYLAGDESFTLVSKAKHSGNQL